MTSIALDVQKNYMILEKSQLEFQELVYSNQKQTITSTLNTLAAAHADEDDYDIEKDTQVLDLKDYESEVDTAMASLESQLKELNAQIESFGKVIDTNIKSDFKLNIFGG